MLRLRRIYWLWGPLLVLGALLAPRASRAYLYEVANRIDPIPVTNLLVADAFRPGGVRMEWDYTPMGSYGPIEHDVERLAACRRSRFGASRTTENGPESAASKRFGTPQRFEMGRVSTSPTGC